MVGMLKLHTKPCRICGAPVDGRRRKDRKAFYYPQQCVTCRHKCHLDYDRRQDHLGGPRVPVGSRRQENSGRGYMYYVIKIADPSAWVYEHRYIMERKLKRPLLSSEHVHHIDENTLNNSPDNLMILSAAEHLQHHQSLGLRWALKHTECLACHGTKRRHLAKGLCTRCYQKPR